jgi:two-component system, NarL family, nitrate/nitrite response regulator NarL
MSTKGRSGKPSGKRNGEIPLMLNTNNRKFKEFMRETIREEVKKLIQTDFKDSEGTNQVVILNNPPEELTPRELEVMNLLIKNYNNRQIAVKLGLKTDTVKIHVKNIIRKSGVKSRWQARDLHLKLHPEAGTGDKEK